MAAVTQQPPRIGRRVRYLLVEVRRLVETEKKFTTGKADVEVVDKLYRGFFEGVDQSIGLLTFIISIETGRM